MQIVIDIPDFTYELVKEYVNEGLFDYNGINATLHKSVANGTVLPKGHGRLIDADYLKDVTLLHNWHGNDKNIVPYSDRRGYRLRNDEVLTALINAPTIIEADKEQEE